MFDADRSDALGFVLTAAISTGAGLLLAGAERRRPAAPDELAVVAFLVAIALAGALPYVWSGSAPSTHCSNRCPG